MNKPSINFKNFPSWNEKELNDFIIEYSNRNNVDLNEVVSIGKYGIRKRSDIYSKELSKDISKNKIITKDSMVIGMGSTQIDIAILLTDNIYSVSPAYSTFKINNINSAYLNYFFNSKIRNLSNKYMIISARQGKTVDKQNLLKHKEYFSNNLEEQQKISTFLSAFDLKIEHESQIIEQLKQLKKGLLYKMFPTENNNIPKLRFKGFTETWEQRKLGDIGQTYTGLSGKTKEDFGHGDGKFVTYMNVFSNPISLPGMTEAVEIDYSQNKVLFGDVLFTTSSETPEEVGMSSVWLENSENTYLNSFCFGYRPTIELNHYYLAYMFRSYQIRKKITFLAQGISRYNISKNKMMDIEIPLPNLNEQGQIGDFFSKIDSLITLHQYKYDKLVQVKNDIFPRYSAYYNNILHNFLPIIFTYAQPQHKSHTKKIY